MRSAAASLRGLFGAGPGRTGGGPTGASRRWQTEGLSALAVETMRNRAREERRAIDRFMLSSDDAVRRSRARLADMPLPDGTDWRWRPPLMAAPLDPPARVSPGNGEGLGDSAHLFHDCDLRAMVVRQVPNRRASDLAAFGLKVEVLGFAGSFLSVAIPLPPDALAGLGRDHVVRLDTQIQIERPLEAFARLNVVNGPNTDRVQGHLGWMRTGAVNHHVTEFDLAETEINPDRLESAWLDLILESPAMNVIVLRDVVLSRHHRAAV